MIHSSKHTVHFTTPDRSIPALTRYIYTEGVLTALSLIAVLTLVTGCKTKQVNKETQTVVQSQRAPYAITLNSKWEKISATEVNKNADLAFRHLDEPFFFMVIPQKLPEISGLPSPSVKAFETVGVQKLRASIKDIYIQEKGAIEIDGKKAISVFAEGTPESDTVQYIVSFITYKNWGFQLVGWGPTSKREALIESIQTLLETLSLEEFSKTTSTTSKTRDKEFKTTKDITEKLKDTVSTKETAQ